MPTPTTLKSNRGFSLVELAVVLVVIALIAAIAIPTFSTVVSRSADRAALTSQQALGRQVSTLVALGETYEAALLAALADMPSAAASGVWAEGTWVVVNEEEAAESIATGELHYVDASVRLSWVAKHRDDATVACLVEDATVKCWLTDATMTAALALSGPPVPGAPTTTTTVPSPPSQDFLTGFTSDLDLTIADMAVAEDGATFATGHFTGTATLGDVTLVSATDPNYWASSDTFVAKLDTDGAVLWATRAGSFYSDQAVGVAPTSDGGAIVTGFYDHSTTLGDTTLSTSTGYSVYVAKVDAAGNWEWALTVPGASRPNDIAATGDGGAIIVGQFSTLATFGSKVLRSEAEMDVYVAKVSSSGQWEWAVSGTNDPNATRVSGKSKRPHNMAVHSDGSITVVGHYRKEVRFGQHVLPEESGDTVFVARLSSAGEWLWASSGGGAASSAARKVVASSNGDVIVAGEFNNTATFGPHQVVSAGSSDVFVAKVDSTGNWVWVTSAGNSHQEQIHALTSTADGGAVVGGHYSRPVSFGPHDLAWTAGQDAYAAKVDSTGNWMWATSVSYWYAERIVALAATHDGLIRVAGKYTTETVVGGETLNTGPVASSGFVATLTASGTFE